MNWLQYTAPTTPLVELARVCAITMGATLALWLVRVAVTRKSVLVDPFTKMVFVALALFAAHTVLQETQQLGKPFLVWRLPLLLLGCTAGWVAVVRKL